ncbi:MAG: type I glyceraldehyde-3-phosphate dehydrogenase [Sulfurovum sp.]|nr:type I glyceraldehyde-3-phosphate dehydrogenase [Sulfurovum sp.]
MESGRTDIEVVGINDLGPVETNAHLLRFDSVHGRFPATVTVDGDTIDVGRGPIKVTAIRDPKDLPWGELNVDIAMECTGIFTARDKAAMHLEAGAKKVIISAPGKGVDKTFVLGVNHEEYDDEKHHVVSNASCTTNSLAPVMKVLEESFGVEYAMITTTHAYTSSQTTVDKRAKKRRRGRAAAVNIIPTTTGAAVATVEVIPSLEGKMEAMALRVPVPDGAITEVVALLKSEVTRDTLNERFKSAAESELSGIMEFSTEELVSTDILGDRHSCIIDGLSTSVIGGKMVKVMAWYDNEYGYSQRLLEMADYIAANMK